MTPEIAADCGLDHDVCEHANEHDNHAPAVELDDAELIGLTPDRLANDPFWQTKLEVAIGANRHEKNWRTLAQTRGELVASLTEFMRGEKDGLCITQGPLVNGQRIAKNVIANHIIMLDCDTGESLDSLLSKVRARGYAAVIWTTYSHMKPQTTIAEDRLVKLARDAKAPMPSVDNQDGLIALARQYLGSKKYAAAILDSISAVDRVHDEGGVKFVVRHDPMTRARVLLFLQEPYVFASAKPTHALAVQDWKEAYAGVAEALGVDYDQSCVDPSRLMYTPRIAHDASGRTPYDLGHEIIVIAGTALDLDTVPRVNARAKATAFEDAVRGAGIGGNSRNGAFKTPDIFRAVKYPDLDIVGLCNTYASEDIKSDAGDKLELTCPNEDRHTEQKEDDRAFMVRSDGEAWWAGCQHATCKADSGEDRAWWLDKLCEKYGLTADDVLTYSATAVAEIDAKAEAEAAAQQAKREAGDTIKARIAAIAETKTPDAAEIDAVADLICQTFEEGAVREEAFEALRNAAGKGKGEFQPIRKAAEKRTKNQSAGTTTSAGVQDDDDVDDMDYSTPLSRDDNGRAHVTRLNFRRAVTQLGVRIWQDVFADDLIIEGLRDCGPEYNDFAEGRLMSLCEERFRLNMTTEKFVRYANDFAFTNRRHPARDYFDKVQEAWDGVPRLDTWAMRYLGVEDTTLNRGMTKTWLVAGPRRIRQPGAKFDEILILESPEQGLSKSAIIELLAVNRRWYVDGIPLGADPKVIMEQTRGILIGEVDELQTSRRADVAQQKSALSRRADRARPAYGRRAQTVDRQFILAGTTNDATYLKDLTGNRRFWPVRIGVTRPIDVEGLTRDLDQLWGEAAAYEAANPSPETIRLDKSLWAAAGREQAKRVVDNPFYDQLAQYLSGRTGKISNYTVYSILALPTGQRSGRAELINAAMLALGWEKRDAVRFGEKVLRGYICGDGIETITADTSGGAITIRVGGKADKPDGGEDGPLLSSFGK